MAQHHPREDAGRQLVAIAFHSLTTGDWVAQREPYDRRLVRPVTASRHFQEWTAGREVSSLGTNDGSLPLPFQKWHKFKEAFAPELIAQAVQQSRIPVHNCYDPFGGSGTTALSSQFLGIDSETVEINPFLADVIRAKLAHYDIDLLVQSLAYVRHKTRTGSVEPSLHFGYLPPTFLPPGRNGRWIYDEPIAERLATLLAAIKSIRQPEVARLFRVIVGGILADVSNVVISGKGRRYRRGLPLEGRDPSEVDQLFADRASRAIRDIARFNRRPRTRTTVVQDDSRHVRPASSVDLCVFSPPYPNSFDYTDVYNLELWMLGYLSDMSENRLLRKSTLSSHVQILREYSTRPAGSERLEEVSAKLRDLSSSLWSRWIPNMVDAYFSDMLNVLDNIEAALAPGGQVWMVVGDSRYAGVTVPVASILCELSAANGWVVKSSEPIRHMRSSAQQGGRADLPESLIVLSR
jgi:DNA modification methylase